MVNEAVPVLRSLGEGGRLHFTPSLKSRRLFFTSSLKQQPRIQPCLRRRSLRSLVKRSAPRTVKFSRFASKVGVVFFETFSAIFRNSHKPLKSYVEIWAKVSVLSLRVSLFSNSRETVAIAHHFLPSAKNGERSRKASLHAVTQKPEAFLHIFTKKQPQVQPCLRSRSLRSLVKRSAPRTVKFSRSASMDGVAFAQQNTKPYLSSVALAKEEGFASRGEAALHRAAGSTSHFHLKQQPQVQPCLRSRSLRSLVKRSAPRTVKFSRSAIYADTLAGRILGSVRQSYVILSRGGKYLTCRGRRRGGGGRCASRCRRRSRGSLRRGARHTPLRRASSCA